MDNRFRRTLSECSKCPLHGRKQVGGISGVESPLFVLVGDAPGRQEESQGVPFVGPAGAWLARAMNEVGVLRHSVHLTNVIPCRPTNNNTLSEETDEAIECCKEGFKEELNYLKRKGVEVLVPMGNVAKNALDVEVSQGIGTVRGFVFEKKGFHVVPTYHPSFIMGGQLSEWPTWLNDIEKAKKIAREGYNAPQERFTLFPTLSEVTRFADRAVGRGSLIGCDIETSGIHPERGAQTWMVGLSWDSEEAICIPFFKKDKVPYWSPEERYEVDKSLKRILEECPIGFQNGLFDVRFLERELPSLKINIAEDTLLAHHALSPELPHNLGYITSVYGMTAYWKNKGRLGEDAVRLRDDEEFRTYNCRDAVVIHQVLPGILADLKREGLEGIYREISLPLIRPVLEMMKNGLRIDEGKLKEWRKSLIKKQEDNEVDLRRVSKVSAGFSFDSLGDLRFLFFGTIPNKARKAEEILKTVKRVDTKKFAEASKVAHVFRDTRPLSIKGDRMGKMSLDKEAFLTLQKSIGNRIQTMENFAKWDEAREKERNHLINALEVIELVGVHREVTKLLSTYTKYPIDADGRVRFQYKIHGTATGRLSSGGKDTAGDAQNIPAEAKQIFVSEKGHAFVEADYSNLELRVLAYVSGDEVLLEQFREGKNIHTENCKLLFDIDESHPNWKDARRAAKVYIFGRNYGGGLKGVFEKVLKEVPKLGLSFTKFVKLDQRYRDAHPAYTKWYEDVRKEVKEKKQLTTALGRKRFFLGTESEISREGLNTPIQSVAADIANKALIRLWEQERDGIWIVAQVHDSIMIEVREELIDRGIEVLKESCDPGVSIKGHDGVVRKCVFPIDIKIGNCWGDLKERTE